MFEQIILATEHQPGAILTDADPAIDSVVHQVFSESYPIYCAYHITQNLHKNLRKTLGDDYKNFLTKFYICRNSIAQGSFENQFNALLREYPRAKGYLDFLYKSKSYWAHCFTNFKFTGGMIATSRVEAVNSCLKRLLYNLNVSLYDLMSEIHRLLDAQDKQQEYNFWRLAIVSVKSQEKVNFLFTRVDNCIQQFLTPAIFKMQRDEINQSVYYTTELTHLQDVLCLDEEGKDERNKNDKDGGENENEDENMEGNEDEKDEEENESDGDNDADENDDVDENVNNENEVSRKYNETDRRLLTLL